MIAALIVVAWLACAFVATGMFVAYFDEKYPGEYRETLGVGALMSLIFGPIGLVTTFFLSGFAKHGWRIGPRND